MAPAGAVLTDYLRRQVDRLLAEEPRVRAGEDDAVHQMRVASRRLRSALRTYRALVDAGWANDVRAELAWLATGLGGARDLEVLGARLWRGLDGLDTEHVRGNARDRVERYLAPRQEQARTAVTETLAAPRCAKLLRRLPDEVARPPLTSSADGKAADVLPRLVPRDWQRLARRAGALHDGSAPADYHRTRIAAKRLRYASEVCAPALGAGPARLARSAEAVQEVLGEHQDAVVAARTLAELGTARGAGVAAFTFGVLHAQETAAAACARAAFPDVWRKASRPKARRWLRR